MKKNWIIKSFLLGFVLIFAGSCVSFQPVPQGELIIIHTNDTHGRVMESPQDGMGFPRIAGIVSKYRKDYPNRVLLLDAGDTFHGTPFAALSSGENVAKVLDSMEYDAVCVGNHDMNYGLERLKELDEIMENTTIISANLRDKNGGLPFKPYIIKTLGPEGVIKVGIFGLSTPQTKYKANPKYVADIEFNDPVETAQKIVDELRGQVHLIICLSHLGTNPAYEVTSIDIARNVHGIDLIVDGHSHTIIEDGLVVEGTPIVQAGYADKYIGIVKLSYGPEGSSIEMKLISKGQANSYNESSSLLASVEMMEEANKQLTSVVVGTAPVKLEGARINVRTKRTNLGTLVAESARWISGADIGFVNGGGIRASIEKGIVTKEALLNVLPFGNTVRVIEISGSDIIAALENGLKALPEPAGAFPQTSGISYKVNINADAANTVSDVQINGEPLEPKRIYTLATSDFLVLGGDEYSMFTDCKVVNEFGTFDEVLENYALANGSAADKLILE